MELDTHLDMYPDYMSFEYVGPVFLAEQEGGFAAPAIDLDKPGWLTTGAVREAVSFDSLDKALERIGVRGAPAWSTDKVVRARILVEILPS